jgi:hypothetical protein
MFSLTAGSAQAQELAGCWDGDWDNWHDVFKGRMKGRITKCSATHYEGEFWGIALIVIPYRYRTTLVVTHVEDGKTYFQGQDFLGIWGGYSICGYICGNEMFARYTKCKGDGGGCLHMCRTCCPCCNGCGCNTCGCR